MNSLILKRNYEKQSKKSYLAHLQLQTNQQNEAYLGKTRLIQAKKTLEVYMKFAWRRNLLVFFVLD